MMRRRREEDAASRMRRLMEARSAVQPPSPQGVGSRAWMLPAGLAVWVVSWAAVIGWGAGAVSGRWDPVWMAAGAAGAAAGVWASKSGWDASGGWRTAAVGAAAAVSLLFLVGAVTQVEIGGTPRLAFSREARAYRMVRDLYMDLEAMAPYDELLSADVPSARARFAEYAPAVDAMDRITARWVGVRPESIPDPDLIEVVTRVKTASYFGGLALETRRQLLLAPDVRTEQLLRDYRETFVAETLTAATLLRPLIERYEVPVRDPEAGE